MNGHFIHQKTSQVWTWTVTSDYRHLFVSVFIYFLRYLQNKVLNLGITIKTCPVSCWLLDCVHLILNCTLCPAISLIRNWRKLQSFELVGDFRRQFGGKRSKRFKVFSYELKFHRLNLWKKWKNWFLVVGAWWGWEYIRTHLQHVIAVYIFSLWYIGLIY